MSDGLEALRRQLDATGDLKSVVRAMKAISATGLNQYEKAVLALRDYDATVRQGLRICVNDATVRAQIRPARGSSAVAIVVFGSDQGLVGQFNEQIVDFLRGRLTSGERPKIWAVGERVALSLEEAGFGAVNRFDLPGSIETVTLLVSQILEAFVQFQQRHQSPALRVFYHGLKGGARYEPMEDRVLPLDHDWLQDLIRMTWPTRQIPETVGPPAPAFAALLREYIFVSLFRACAESLASENASRLVAMQRAEKNIDELSGNLSRKFHRLRQSSIDEELFDVIAGFEALQHPRRS